MPKVIYIAMYRKKISIHLYSSTINTHHAQS